MQSYLRAIEQSTLTAMTGRVTAVIGQTIESRGPNVSIGEICELRPRGGKTIRAEVVGIRPGKVILMPYGDVAGVGSSCEVVATDASPALPVGEDFLGRVIDAFGEPIDGLPAPNASAFRQLQPTPVNPLTRPRVTKLLETGIRAIDVLMPLGAGQRVGIFAGSGVGKSTLLSMLAKRMDGEINVIALIGERGREVREFVEQHLSAEALARSIVVVATSDQPALARVRAAYAATVMAEYFRDQGKHVMLMMDSITRLAMARREIGLAAGEPPTARGYTPSVFSEIPALCERCGTADTGGSITALYTVLVEGDDFNEPISDIVRATLDGHIMLSRSLAHEGHFPAIDVLQSVSRLAGELASPQEKIVMRAAVEVLATYERNRQMIDMGAYQVGSSADIDRAIAQYPSIKAVLQQRTDELASRDQALASLSKIVVG